MCVCVCVCVCVVDTASLPVSWLGEERAVEEVRGCAAEHVFHLHTHVEML